MRVSRVTGAVLSGVLATVTFGAIPAHAEGSKTSYISYWATGAESGRWTDNNNDGASTTVRLSNCTTASSPNTRTSAAVSVWKDVFGPDTNKGSKSDVCSATKSWGTSLRVTTTSASTRSMGLRVRVLSTCTPSPSR